MERKWGKGMSDLIGRQAAIDALARTAREKFNLSDEFNHYLAGLMDGETAIRQLPSAQPKIIHCRECRYWKTDHPTANGYHCCHRIHNAFPMREDDFCSQAERREE
jgi:hypothetical protein